VIGRVIGSPSGPVIGLGEGNSQRGALLLPVAVSISPRMASASQKYLKFLGQAVRTSLSVG
jgi:hypothetical protein